MATRFWFPAATAADVAGGFWGGWNYTSEMLRRKLVATKGSSAVGVGAQIGPWTSGQTAGDRQYVSEPLAAQTISGTVSMQLMVREYGATDDVVNIYLYISVVSNDGQTELANLFNNGNTVTELVNNATHRNQTFENAAAFTSYACADGDRLIVEVGYSDDGTSTTPEASAKWGENATDLPVNSTQTTDGAGWIEFSGTITFQSSGQMTSAGGDMAFTGTGDIGARLPMTSAAGDMAFTGTGTIGAVMSMTPAAGDMVFTGTGSIGARVPLVSADGDVVFGGTGGLTSYGLISGSDTVAFGGTGTLSAILQEPITGSDTIAFGGTGTISSVTQAPLTGSADIAFGGTGGLSAISPMVGSASVAFGGTGSLLAILQEPITGTADIVFGATGILLDGRPRYLIYHEDSVVGSPRVRTEVAMLDSRTTAPVHSLAYQTVCRASIEHEAEIDE